eukprot:COSAG01_NODE_7776_length_3061_cov_11.754303_2_plen_82_part_00
MHGTLCVVVKIELHDLPRVVIVVVTLVCPTNVEFAPFTAFFEAEAAHDDARTVRVLAVHDAVWLASLDCESTSGAYDINFI